MTSVQQPTPIPPSLCPICGEPAIESSRYERASVNEETFLCKKAHTWLTKWLAAS